MPDDSPEGGAEGGRMLDKPDHSTGSEDPNTCDVEHYYVRGLLCALDAGHKGWHQNGVVWL